MSAFQKKPPRNFCGLLLAASASVFASLALYLRIGPFPPHLSFDRWVVSSDPTVSRNVSLCPGYNLTSVKNFEHGLVANLVLAGKECHAYGTDYKHLVVEVAYETATRLRVNIRDAEESQFTIQNDVLGLPLRIPESLTHPPDLLFNYETSPFSFWITRRSDPQASPLFDTRVSSLPGTPIPPVIPDIPSTSLDGFPLVFEDRYLQLTSALPLDANVYGLGEVVASSGFRRDTGGGSGRGSVQTMWNRDSANPVDGNMYGSHPVYLEHRLHEHMTKPQSHGVYLHSAAASDILLLTPPSSQTSLIQYRMLGGTLDFYFFSGPSPSQVIEQYSEVVGKPAWQNAWAFGYQQCRWGYEDVSELRGIVRRMNESKIPLEVIWSDIDLYHAYRDFTTDPVRYPTEDIRSFISALASAANEQHYVPIVDAAIPVLTNKTDAYPPYETGKDLDVFIKNPDGTEHIGQVWPGYTVFPDWFSPKAQRWWTTLLSDWSSAGVLFSGIWLDMNEVSSFCDGSCGTGANLSNTSVPFYLPGHPNNLVIDYPEGYNVTRFGPSGNLTVNGTHTYDPSVRINGVGNNVTPGSGDKRHGTEPSYSVHNGNGPLSSLTIAANATHASGLGELDVHNLWGLMNSQATFKALLEIRRWKRPFIISRSTFAGSGTWAGHWLGDNFSRWESLRYSIQGVLQFQIFQIPFVGADTCGFIGNTDEELCNRWMTLSAYLPFFRNHNILSAIPQEPYVWDSVADASRDNIAVRYSLLPYWYTLFADASRHGTPPIKALFYEFPDEPELFAVDKQFMIGNALLVTPVLHPNVTTVQGHFPGIGIVIWRDFFTYERLLGSAQTQNLEVPLGKIGLHIRSGAAIVLHQEPGHTIASTRRSDLSLLVSLSPGADGVARGRLYLDDGESQPPTPHRDVEIFANGGRRGGKLRLVSEGTYVSQTKVQKVVILINDGHDGQKAGPAVQEVRVKGQTWDSWTWDGKLGKLVVESVGIDLNESTVDAIDWR
ncbi:glycosyl hydrolases family 31-domain-containing protein [Thelephora terrestris]|uniref:alpha-glucosidase n=1 Tax=Thelephora terrestris TaxID=56493 RepID=A0A9P6H8J0_9AGAM|nr:glycosyl hydrolases family 31-domain-containing protein [Thelephora terrestris]